MKDPAQTHPRRLARQLLESGAKEGQRAERLERHATAVEAVRAEEEAGRRWQQVMERRAARITRWAMERDQRELAQLFGQLVVVAIEARKNDRMFAPLAVSLSEQVSVLNERARSSRVELVTQTLARQHGAREKLKRDPKQAAKAQARKLWQDWQAGRTLHKSGAAFARHVVRELPILESTKVVERWTREWKAACKNSHPAS